MKVTAIILCRENSSRLKKKHFKKIGNLTILEIIIKNLKKLNYIDKIVIATGSKKRNSSYEKFIKQKKIKKINFFYHDKEENVTERVFLTAQKFENTYTLLISGDCILLDKEFIDYYLKKICYYHKFNFVNFLEKKNFYFGFEGIKLFRTSIWNKVNEYSNTDMLQEHPGYVVSKYPNKFKIKNINADKKFYLNTKVRLSIDTQSDLDFFRSVHFRNDKKNITISSIKKNIFLKKINKHVSQKIPEQLSDKKIILITIKSKKFGLGHYKRTLTLKREISETYTSAIKFINLEKFDLNKLKSIKNSNIVIDVPLNVLLKLEKKIDGITNRVVLIDQTKSNFQNKLLIVPSLYVEPTLRKKILYGINYLIIRRDLFFNQLIDNKNVENKLLLLCGGSFTPTISIINQIKENFNINCDIHLGPYAQLSDKKNRKKNNYRIINNTNFKDLFFRYKTIITRLGVTVYELLSIAKVPYVILKNEKCKIRKQTIFYLYRNKYINILGKKKIKPKKIKINFGCQKVVLRMMKFFSK